MQRLKLTAIVLRTVDYGESDRVVALLSVERGKLSAFARGARASRRRFGGALEPFTLLAAEVKERPSSDLATLESVTVTRAFGGIRTDLARIACAGYACELSRELVRDHEPHAELFELLASYLDQLDSAPARPWGLRAFELGALRAGGLMPRLDACARCGQDLSSQWPARLAFDPSQGGFLCGLCAPSAAPRGLEAALETARALSRLQEGGIEAFESEQPPPGAGAEARDLLSAFIEHHLGKRLGSRRFLDEVGPVLAR
jgi:DNA repair protein RecO (recombination protein O)